MGAASMSPLRLQQNFVLLSLFWWVVTTAVVFGISPFTHLLDSLWRSFLGSEGMNYLTYHMKRGIVVLLTVAFSCFGYATAIILANPVVARNLNLNNLDVDGLELGQCIAVYVGVAVTYLLCGVGIATTLLAFLWTFDGFKYHPTRKALEYYNQNWVQVLNTINAEFRSPDKISVTVGYHQVSVTTSWILQTNLFLVNFALQDDSDFSIVDARDVQAMEHADGGTRALLLNKQLIHIRITSLNPHQAEFIVLINSDQYRMLEMKLTMAVTNVHNIALRLTDSDDFLVDFRELVAKNPPYEYHNDDEDEAGEMCIGCKVELPDAKICVRSGTQCKCRPFFCTDCLGRWFASRQDERKPVHEWRNGFAQCPTCHVRFTVNDVSRVVAARPHGVGDHQDDYARGRQAGLDDDADENHL